MRKTLILDHLEDWLRSNEEELRRRGLAPSFERGPVTPKSAAWANLDGNGWIVQVIAWESGEVELLARREECEELEVNEYHVIYERAELVERLTRLADLVTGGV